MTKVRETAIIINKVIYRKKKKCLGLTSFRDPSWLPHMFIERWKENKPKKAEDAWP